MESATDIIKVLVDDAKIGEMWNQRHSSTFNPHRKIYDPFLQNQKSEHQLKENFKVVKPSLGITESRKVYGHNN